MLAKVAEPVRSQILARIPMGRFGKPEEIAKAVLFLAADGDYITGQQINVNGGVYIAVRADVGQNFQRVASHLAIAGRDLQLHARALTYMPMCPRSNSSAVRVAAPETSQLP